MTIVPLIVGYFAIQWNRANYLGKTPEQMVAMGRTKWNSLYGSKVGNSTVDMTEGEGKYGDALKNLNDRAMKRLPSKRQNWLKSVRKSSSEYAFEAHRIGELVSGGGTMWRLFDSSVYPDVEQLVADCIVDKKMPMIKMKSFEAANKELDLAIEKARADLSGATDYNNLLKHRKNLAQKQNDLLSLVSQAGQNDATRIRLYMHKNIETAKSDNLKI